MRGKGTSLSSILGAAAALFVVAAGASPSDGRFEVAGRVTPPPSGQLAGGAFVLSGEVSTPADTSEVGPVHEPTWLLSTGGERSPMGTLCFCATAIFGDGFESGGTATWSDTIP